MQLSDPFVLSSWEALIFWGAFVWAFAPEMLITHKAAAAPTGRTRSQDAGTVRLIMAGNATAILAAFLTSFLPRFAMPEPRVALYVGTGLLVVGSLLRRWCWRTLGKYFTGNVVVAPGQPVIDRGPYRLVRHPSYTAGIIVLVGVGTAFGNWVSLALLFLEPWFLYIHRVRVEERALLATLGEPYRAYMARTKRFIPFVI
jgi:protein-S-isoprenylcysteine O-methyltransferase Ste14